uniref:Uncharacterized protein n=1 Tax=Rhizophora mucronata TaxID=61149 RepID=A0A2P2MYQ9_RHIMU
MCSKNRNESSTKPRKRRKDKQFDHGRGRDRRRWETGDQTAPIWKQSDWRSRNPGRTLDGGRERIVGETQEAFTEVFRAKNKSNNMRSPI